MTDYYNSCPSSSICLRLNELNLIQGLQRPLPCFHSLVKFLPGVPSSLFVRSRPVLSVSMAATIKAINAKIRSNKVLDYFCSTHFWGPASNFGIPVAAVLDTQKDPEIISGTFTAALTVYSATFMRYALAVTPKNYLLFGCHFVNFNAQLTQMYRWYDYWYMGGQDKWAKIRAEKAKLEDQASSLAEQAKDKVGGAVNEVKKTVS
ncbi:hypothetical protein HRR85_003683 [Exophiala dermatitidis]|nr:hypothetical protein HRR85_003683 [Exophiala dermatitidis]